MKNKNAPWLIVMIVLLAAVIIYRFTPDKKETNDTMEMSRLRLSVTGSTGKIQEFTLGAPVSVSREAFLSPFSVATKSPNAFHLPMIRAQTLEFAGQFVGDVHRGGPCNVDRLSYVPHGLTHLETSAHVLDPNSHPPTVKDIPLENLSGIVFLIDVTHLGGEPGQQIPWPVVETKLKQNTLPVSMLALKTKASLLPSDYDFSGKDFLSLAPATAAGIHDYRIPIPGPGAQRIRCLILDLPSIDPEKDEGKLSAHRCYFGLPLEGHTGVDGEKRALVELAWFSGLEGGYYYAIVTPPRFQANAVSTGIVFYPLLAPGIK